MMFGVIIFLLFISLSTVGSQEQRVYTAYSLKDSVGKVCLKSSQSYITYRKRSSLECSLLCHDTATCSGYNFHGNTGHCHIFLRISVDVSPGQKCLSYWRQCNPIAGKDAETECSFPNTHARSLHNRCYHINNDICRTYCLDQQRNLMQCRLPNTFEAKDEMKWVAVVSRNMLSINNWIIVQSRLDADNQNFKKTYSDYVNGFNSGEGGFWIGLETTYQILKNRNYKLRFELQSYDGTWYSAEYYNSYLGNAASRYAIYAGTYVGDAGNALIFNDPVYNLQGKPFYSYDNVPASCKASYTGGWWMNACAACHLNNAPPVIVWATLPNGVSRVKGSRMLVKMFI